MRWMRFSPVLRKCLATWASATRRSGKSYRDFSDLLDAAAFYRALDSLETTDVHQHFFWSDRVGCLTEHRAAECLEIVAHRWMRWKKHVHRSLVAVDAGHVPAGRMLRVAAVADFHPAPRSQQRKPAHEWRRQHRAQVRTGPALKAERDRQRVAVLEMTAQLREPRPYAGRPSKERNRKIDHVNAGGRKRTGRVDD